MSRPGPILTQPVDLVDDLCGSSSPLDLPGSIRACLQAGLVSLAYLKALKINGLNIPPLDAPPTSMCYVQASNLLSSLIFTYFIETTGLGRLPVGWGTLPVVETERGGESIEVETVKKINTDLMFILIIIGRRTRAHYPFLVYSYDAYKMRVVSRIPVYVAVPIPPAIYNVVKKNIVEICGLEDDEKLLKNPG